MSSTGSLTNLLYTSHEYISDRGGGVCGAGLGYAGLAAAFR